jgi:hypothetical protein
MHIAFFGQLPLSKHVADVPADYRAFAAKQLGHLGLAEPDGVSLQAHIEGNLAVGGRVEKDLTAGVDQILIRRQLVNHLLLFPRPGATVACGAPPE